MRLWEKLADVGELVKSEVQRHFGEDDPKAGHGEILDDEDGGPLVVHDPQTAWRVLELPPGSDLDEVREAYRRLARAYHPQAQGEGREAEAAEAVLGSLLQALELLEEHLLPLSEGAGAR